MKNKYKTTDFGSKLVITKTDLSQNLLKVHVFIKKCLKNA